MLQHNFTDGMALGSAFLLYGSVGGWSRTIFLLAHELPQEVFFLNGAFNLLSNTKFTAEKLVSLLLYNFSFNCTVYHFSAIIPFSSSSFLYGNCWC